jgi:hypothetical protein
VPQQPDLLTVPERISLLNPTFHPVLSFPEGEYCEHESYCGIAEVENSCAAPRNLKSLLIVVMLAAAVVLC